MKFHLKIEDIIEYFSYIEFVAAVNVYAVIGKQPTFIYFSFETIYQDKVTNIAYGWFVVFMGLSDTKYILANIENREV